MNTIYVPAFAAFGGSALAAISTFVTGWVTGRRRHRERHYARSTSKRERLYRSFIEEASRLYADALVSNRSEIPQLVNLYALVGRMRILSCDEVVHAAEKVGRLIIETYLSPNREFVDLPKFMEEMIPCVASAKPADANCIRSHLAEVPGDAAADTPSHIVVRQ